MPLKIIRADITKIEVDAIVNAANTWLVGGGGVDGAIHKVAGIGLLEECKKIGGCPIGEVRLTSGYDLPAEYVIHTVGPVWEGGGFREEELLEFCYKNSLDLALNLGLNSIAFPLISAGTYGFPKERALEIAVDMISKFLEEHEMEVTLVVYDKRAYAISKELFDSVQNYIDENYILEFDDDELYNESYNQISRFDERNIQQLFNIDSYSESSKEESSSRKLEDILNKLQETFSEHLLNQIDLMGKTDVEVYKKANIDRKLFSKIRSDKNYKPSKATAIALAIGLELNLDETKDLLQKAGFALSKSSKFDVIIEYFITEEFYNIHEINSMLFEYNLSLLGM